MALTKISHDDNDKAVFGTSEDLQIFHDGTDSVIDNNTGDLVIRGDGDDLKLIAADNIVLMTQTSEVAINCTGNGDISLYYDAVEKFETKSNGAKVQSDTFATLEIRATGASDAVLVLVANDDLATDWTIRNDYSESNRLDYRHNNVSKMNLDTSGNLTITGNFDVGDNDKLLLGNSDDLQIYHDGSNSYLKNTVTGNLYITNDGGGTINLQTNGSENAVKCIEDGAVELYHDNSKKFETNSTGAKCHGSQLSLVNTAGAGDAKLYLEAGEGGTALIQFMADEGDNDSDKYRLLAPDAGPFAIQTYSAGSWENNLTCTQDGAVELYHNNVVKTV